jgi:hypothetical protein
MQNQDKTLRIPPLMAGSDLDRYDSVTNKEGTHTIIYSNPK